METRYDCAWCGASLRDGKRLPDRTLCSVCGVSTTDPWPSDTELEQAYGGWYRPEGGRFSGMGDALLARTRAALARRLDRIAPPGRVLDVGAGDGALLDALRDRGREVVGTERTTSPLDVRGGDLGEEPDDAWAAVVFWHSLEHLREPGQAVEKAARLLCSDGVLVVAIPNSASLQARVFGDRWLALDMPRHLVHLTGEALRDRLQSLGFRIERTSYLRGGQVLFGWLHGMVGELPGHPSLYDAIRRPGARSRSMSGAARAATLIAGVVALPFAAVATAVEVVIRRGGTVYVEARCP